MALGKLFNFLMVSLCLVTLPSTAATVSETGFGFEYEVAARDGDGSNVVSVNDGEALAVSQSASGRSTGATVDNLASATGSLADGKIGLQTFDSDMASPAFGASASISLHETLFFDLRGFDNSFRTDVTIGFDVEGTYEVDGSGLFNGANVLGNFQAGTGNGLGDFLFTSFLLASTGAASERGQVFSASAPAAYMRGTTGGDWDELSSTRYSGRLTLQGGQINELDLSLRLRVDGTADFSNGASLFVDSPFAYTSASGSFLVDDPSPVPLPSTLPLLLAGLGIIGFSRSKKAVN